MTREHLQQIRAVAIREWRVTILRRREKVCWGTLLLASALLGLMGVLTGPLPELPPLPEGAIAEPVEAEPFLVEVEFNVGEVGPLGAQALTYVAMLPVAVVGLPLIFLALALQTSLYVEREDQILGRLLSHISPFVLWTGKATGLTMLTATYTMALSTAAAFVWFGWTGKFADAAADLEIEPASIEVMEPVVTSAGMLLAGAYIPAFIVLVAGVNLALAAWRSRMGVRMFSSLGGLFYGSFHWGIPSAVAEHGVLGTAIAQVSPLTAVYRLEAGATGAWCATAQLMLFWCMAGGLAWGGYAFFRRGVLAGGTRN